MFAFKNFCQKYEIWTYYYIDYINFLMFYFIDEIIIIKKEKKKNVLFKCIGNNCWFDINQNNIFMDSCKMD